MALDYNQERRLTTVIQQFPSQVSRAPTMATLINIKKAIGGVKQSFDPFDFGRNYYNTLNGIVWAVAAMGLIGALKEDLGITGPKEPHEYIPAAFKMFVWDKMKDSSLKENNKIKTSPAGYKHFRDCAIHSRNFLMEMAVMKDDDSSFADQGGELEIWLDHIAPHIEGYSHSFRYLSGKNIGDPNLKLMELPHLAKKPK
jgi:hypothetical protein